VADRNERRNITAGMKAMARAILSPDPSKGGRGKKASPNEGFSATLLSQARTVKKYAPTLVEKVRDGFSLNDAYEVAMTGKFSMASTSANTR
jgi:hypothetical protein